MAASELWLPPSAAVSNHKKADPPKLGDKFGAWAGRDTTYLTMPGGGVLQFDLSRLTLSDYRSMRDHYQINSSLAILSFMMHQLDWKIECKDKKIAAAVEDNMRQVWTRLIRGLSQAYWAGYSPLVIEWDNDIQNKQIVATKFKDLVPEESYVNWKQVDGYAPPGMAKPKFNEYDGIKHQTQSFPIPADNTLWYPLLMENGDYYGKKLLRSAFPAWFFSILIHLFSNRYFERFGEPVPIGRAPYGEGVIMDGKNVDARDAMLNMITQLRSRSAIVLPSEREEVGANGRSEYTYDIEYLESQMRGADFERYLTRLDEEMSIGLFTPILLLRTADVGSYNLGQGHMQMYMWMLNALAGDLKEYIDRYYVSRFVDFNYGPNAPRAQWVPRPLGKESDETMRTIVDGLIKGNRVKPDIEQLGESIGLTLKEIKEVTADPSVVDPNAVDPNAVDPKAKSTPIKVTTKPKTAKQSMHTPATLATVDEIKKRIGTQVEKAYRDETFGISFQPSLGFRRRFEESLKASGLGVSMAAESTNALYTRMNVWLWDVIALGTEEFETAESFMTLFNAMIDTEVDELATR